MKRVLVTLLACLVLSGCAGQEPPEQPVSISDISEPQTPEPEQPAQQAVYPPEEKAPLQIQRGYEETEEGYILYPQVTSGSVAEKINAAICAAITARAGEYDTQVFTEYRIEHNANGLFSIVLYLRDLRTDEMLEEIPLTFDCASGDICDITYYFDVNDAAWRSVIAAMVTQKAEESGLTLLREVAPLADDRQYYLSGENLVVQYRLYEISTHSAGWPEFDIPIREIQAYLAPGSPLLRMVASDAL